jgi:hypothetical protein
MNRKGLRREGRGVAMRLHSGEARFRRSSLDLLTTSAIRVLSIIEQFRITAGVVLC